MDAGTIRILFQKSPRNIWEKLINLWTRGPYFHTAILLPGKLLNDFDNELYESLNSKGVHCILNFIPLTVKYDIIELHPGTEAVEKMREFLKGELGCPYDWSGLFWSQILFIPRSHAHAWICSELVAATLNVYYKMDDACKYSPNSLNRQVKKPSNMIAK